MLGCATTAMETQLKIVWDGDTPGLREHRLSIHAFGPSLKTMLMAMRRIASSIVTQAQEVGDSGAQGGRLAKLAKQIDLEITHVEKGSLGLVMACVLRLASGQNAELLDRLADQVCTEFISAIELESAGQPRNGVVRKFLRTLPEGVNTQTYTLQRSDGVQRTIKIGKMALATLAAESPYLHEVVANIVGVGFEPGRLEVRLQDSVTKKQITCTATSSLVNTAIYLRTQSVHALIVANGSNQRLLRLRAFDSPPQDFMTISEETLIWQRWDSLLRRLAQ